MEQHDREEREQPSAAQWREGVLKAPGGDRRTYDREMAADEETAGGKAQLLQPQEILSESESETSSQVGRRRREEDGSDSEPEDQQEVLNEPPSRVRRVF